MRSKRSKAWHRRKEIARARALIERGIDSPSMRYGELTRATIQRIAKEILDNVALKVVMIYPNAVRDHGKPLRFRRWPK